MGRQWRIRIRRTHPIPPATRGTSRRRLYSCEPSRASRAFQTIVARGPSLLRRLVLQRKTRAKRPRHGKDRDTAGQAAATAAWAAAPAGLATGIARWGLRPLASSPQTNWSTAVLSIRSTPAGHTI